MVVDWIGDDDSCVHIFSEDGDYLDRFNLQGRNDLSRFPRIAFHQLTESVVIARIKKEGLVVYLTIIPRARMGYESVDHEAEGRMVY